jgi:hypothetical protein
LIGIIVKRIHEKGGAETPPVLRNCLSRKKS